MSDPALAQPLPGQRAALRSRWLGYAAGDRGHRRFAVRLHRYLLAHEPDGLRDQRAARDRARLHPRLCRPAQPRAFGVLRAGRLCLDAADREARHSVLDCVRCGRRLRRHCRNVSLAVRGAPARPLSGHRLARLCGHRSSDPAELDQPDAGAARHLRHRAAAGDRHWRRGHCRLPQSCRVLLLGRRLRLPVVHPAEPAGALPDRGNVDRDPRGRSVRRFARHQWRGLEGLRLRRRIGGRRRCRMLLRKLRRHAGAGCVLRVGGLHTSSPW